jgi:chromosome partitioning protein
MDSRKRPDGQMDRPARIIAMLNQKGGVGKTTSVVNLGAALARQGLRICVIDLDPQAHLSLHLGFEQDPDDRRITVYDLLVDPDCPARDALVHVAENLDLIPAEVDLAGADTELSTLEDRQQLLRRKFSALEHDYDVVLLDCPPSLGLLAINALTLAREVFVPMQAHFLALQGVSKLLETVGMVCQSVNPDLRVTGVLLCMHEGQTTLAREVVADLETFFESVVGSGAPWGTCRVLHPPIRRNIKLAEAPSFGQTIFDYSPQCAGAGDYRALAENLVEYWTVAQDESLNEEIIEDILDEVHEQPVTVAPPQAVIDSMADDPLPQLPDDDDGLAAHDTADGDRVDDAPHEEAPQPEIVTVRAHETASTDSGRAASVIGDAGGADAATAPSEPVPSEHG